MSLFRNTVFVAVLAGLLAGFAMFAIQQFTTVPLIFQAETFEGAAPPAPHHDGAAAPAAEQAAPAVEQAAPAAEAPEAWSPADGFERTAYSLGVNLVTGIGFALILVVASELAGGIATWRQGMLWGLAGFAVFTLAPSLGLPPNMPSMPAAELGVRQTWWIATAAATAAGLAMIVFRGTFVWAMAGLALIILPHAIGAPQPASYETAVPDSLHRSFIVAATMTNLVFWVLLGGLVSVVRNRWFASQLDGVQGRLA